MCSFEAEERDRVSERWVLKSVGVGLVCLIWAGVFAAEPALRPIGYVVENPTDSQDAGDALVTVLSVTRNGRTLELTEGDAVFPGDVLATDSQSSISVAFLDRSAVKLFSSTQVRLNSDPYADGLLGGSILEGHASVAFQTAVKKTGELNFGAGARSISARAGSSGGAKLDIIVQKDFNNNFLATVGVVAGTATLQLVNDIKLAGTNSTTGVSVTAGSTLALTLLTPVKGFTGPNPVTLTQGNLSKDELKTLRGNSVAEYLVATAKGGVTITATIKESDATVTVVKETVVNGVVTKDSSQTKDPFTKKTVSSWSESATKVSFKTIYQGFSLSASIAKGAPGKATLKGPDKNSYKGSVTYDATTGKVTFTTTTPAKDGSSVTFTYDPRGNRGTIETLIKVDKNGKATQTTTTYDRLNGEQVTITQTGTFANGAFTADSTPPKRSTIVFAPNAPNPITPDGHSIDQNSPPPVTSP